MTCVAAIADGQRVYMGADSAGVSGWDLCVRADPKVFRNGEFVMGFTTSFRMGQLLRWEFEPPSIELSPQHYMSTKFVNAVRACLKAGGFAKKDNEVESGGTFMVGVRGSLFVIEGDYQVAEPADRYAAVGSGANVALGALYATEGMEPVDRIRTALRAAERFNAGVRGPFTVVHT